MKTSRQFSSRWFRFYDEVVDDPKVQSLPDKLFRFWVNLLCLASQNNGELPGIEDIAWKVRKPASTVEAMLRELSSPERGLLDRTGMSFKPHNWDNRQFKGDISTERVREFRKRRETVSCNVSSTEVKRDETATETAPEQSRTEQSRTDGSPRASPSSKTPLMVRDFQEFDFPTWFEERYSKHPKKRDRGIAERYAAEAVASGSLIPVEFDAVHDEWCATEAWRWKSGANAPTLAEFILDKGWKYRPVTEMPSPKPAPSPYLTPEEFERRNAGKTAPGKSWLDEGRVAQ